MARAWAGAAVVASLVTGAATCGWLITVILGHMLARRDATGNPASRRS